MRKITVWRSQNLILFVPMPAGIRESSSSFLQWRGSTSCWRTEKERRVEAPKRKKRRHVLFVSEDSSRLADKIKRSEKITNSELRRTLAAYRGEVQPDQEG